MLFTAAAEQTGDTALFDPTVLVTQVASTDSGEVRVSWMTADGRELFSRTGDDPVQVEEAGELLGQTVVLSRGRASGSGRGWRGLSTGRDRRVVSRVCALYDILSRKRALTVLRNQLLQLRQG